LLFERHSNKSTNIAAVYPEVRIKEDADIFNPNYVQNVVVNSASNKIVNLVDILLIDELQYVLNPETQRHAVLDIPHKHLMGNAAFLDSEQIKLLESKGITHCFELSETDGLKLGLIPEFSCINIPIELTFTEKGTYYDIDKQYKECIDFIYPVFENKSQAMMFVLLNNQILRESTVATLKSLGIECSEKQLFGKILKYLKLVKKRMDLLKTSQNKIDATLKLINKHKGQKGIIFVNSIETANKLQTIIGQESVVYSSKTKEKPLKEFRDGIYNIIIVIGKANVGFISEELEYSINVSYEAKPLKARQRKGRTQSVNPNNLNKKPVNYFFYVPDFFHFGKEILSQDRKWLKEAQKGWLFVEYKTLEEVLL
jgi:hypothetical protein